MPAAMRRVAYILAVGAHCVSAGEVEACNGGSSAVLEGSMTYDIAQGDYTSNADCTWEVQCACGQPSMTLTRLDTETGFDLLLLYDGSYNKATHTGKQLAKQSGTASPLQSFDCGTDTITVRLTSDASLEGQGFDATVSCQGGGGCGHLGELATHVIADGNPIRGEITADASSAWFALDAEAGKTYQLDVDLVTLSDSEMKLLDVDEEKTLAENDDDDRAASSIDRSSFIEWTCATPGTYFVEVTGFHGQQTGTFELTVAALFATEDPCNGGAVLSPVGSETTTISLQPAGADGGYISNADCQWKLHCGCGKPTITFTQLETEAQYDVVTLYDGLDMAGPGTEVSGNLHALAEKTHSTDLAGNDEGGDMMITFKSDGSVEAGGFAANVFCLDGELCKGRPVIVGCNSTAS